MWYPFDKITSSMDAMVVAVDSDTYKVIGNWGVAFTKLMNDIPINGQLWVLTDEHTLDFDIQFNSCWTDGTFVYLRAYPGYYFKWEQDGTITELAG